MSAHTLFQNYPQIAGIVNVTPDSFSDGGQYNSTERAIAHGMQCLKDGAHILDIGGESSRPGAKPVGVDEELRRVIPVIEGILREKPDTVISIDSVNAPVMEAAIASGAHIINDISALTHDANSLPLAARLKVPVIAMHRQGTSDTMQDNPSYNNIIDDIFEYFKGRLKIFETAGIDPNMVIFDPGIGFGKTDEHNLALLCNIKAFYALKCPLMLGTSRKSFIGRLSNDSPVDKRLGGSLASVLWGLSQGVHFFRVHDVRETAQAFAIWQAIEGANGAESGQVLAASG